MDECLVDDAFVCNASMPICPASRWNLALRLRMQVEEELESGETEATKMSSKGLLVARCRTVCRKKRVGGWRDLLWFRCPGPSP